MAQDDEQPQLGRHEPSLESQERPTLGEPYEVMPAREVAALRKELEEVRQQVDMQRGFAAQGQPSYGRIEDARTDRPGGHYEDGGSKLARDPGNRITTVRASVPRMPAPATAPSQPMPTRVGEAAGRVAQLAHEMDDARRTFRAASEAKNHLEQLYDEAKSDLANLMAELQGAEY